MFRPFIFKTPIRRQLDPIECGAVCLGIVLQAYGKSVSNHDLRAACCTSRRGSDAANIIEAAHRFNLKATAKKCLASDLKSQAGPAILFFDAAHFVVFEGYFFKKFYINDPARGRYALTLQQLRLRFSNVLIALAKDERFGSCTEIPKSAASSLGTPTKISSSLLGMFFAMLFLTVAAGLGLLLGDADKAARVSGDWLFSGLLLLTGWLVFGWWIFWAYIKRSWLDCAKQDVSDIITGVIKMPYGFFDEIPFSVVSKIIASSPSARFFGTLWSSYRYFFMVVMAMVFLAITAILPWAGLILLATLLVFAMLSLIPARFGRGCQNGFGNISLALSAANDMRAMGQTQLVVDGLMFDSFQRIPVGISCCLLAMPISVALFFYLFSLTVPQAFYDGTLAMSEIFSMLVLAYGFAFSAHKLLMKQAELKDDIAKIDALKREFAARTDQVVIAARSDQNALIELRDVSFSYRGEQAKIVERVNLTILSGQLIGVVGRPRSGKSTLLRLLGNKLTQTDGDIIHYVEHNQKLRIANIDQDADLIKASLKDNLTLYHHDITELTIVDALKQAEALDIFYNRPMGLLANIRAHGSNLSLGEKKRLLLAQAILQRPNLIICDNLLDSFYERTSLSILRNLKERATTAVFTSYRHSELVLADRVIVLEGDGSITIDRHEKLLAYHRTYQQFISS